MLAGNTFDKKWFFEIDIRNIRKVDNILKSNLCFCFETSKYLTILQMLLICVLKYRAFGDIWNKFLIFLYIFHYIVKLHLIEWDYLSCFVFYWSLILFKWPYTLLTLQFLKNLKEITFMIYNYKSVLNVLNNFYLFHF